MAVAITLVACSRWQIVVIISKTLVMCGRWQIEVAVAIPSIYMTLFL